MLLTFLLFLLLPAAVAHLALHGMVPLLVVSSLVNILSSNPYAVFCKMLYYPLYYDAILAIVVTVGIADVQGSIC